MGPCPVLLPHSLSKQKKLWATSQTLKHKSKWRELLIIFSSRKIVWSPCHLPPCLKGPCLDSAFAVGEALHATFQCQAVANWSNKELGMIIKFSTVYNIAKEDLTCKCNPRTFLWKTTGKNVNPHLQQRLCLCSVHWGDRYPSVIRRSLHIIHNWWRHRQCAWKLSKKVHLKCIPGCT